MKAAIFSLLGTAVLGISLLVPMSAVKAQDAEIPFACQSATPNRSLDDLLVPSTEPLTIGRQIYPSAIFFRDNPYIFVIDKGEGAEIVCAFLPGQEFKNLTLSLGTTRTNQYALPRNVISVGIFLNGKLAQTVRVVPTEPLKTVSVPLGGAREFALRVDCLNNRCPSLAIQRIGLN